ncbi:hypothetical protein EDB89DRAFT_1903490 [Lactarius sanguifluus]|nr:hypothetical protein EDB89DRAFT_1903490 [Lactarius sanguifluus]
MSLLTYIPVARALRENSIQIRLDRMTGVTIPLFRASLPFATAPQPQVKSLIWSWRASVLNHVGNGDQTLRPQTKFGQDTKLTGHIPPMGINTSSFPHASTSYSDTNHPRGDYIDSVDQESRSLRLGRYGQKEKAVPDSMEISGEYPGSPLKPISGVTLDGDVRLAPILTASQKPSSACGKTPPVPESSIEILLATEQGELRNAHYAVSAGTPLFEDHVGRDIVHGGYVGRRAPVLGHRDLGAFQVDQVMFSGYSIGVPGPYLKLNGIITEPEA